MFCSNETKLANIVKEIGENCNYKHSMQLSKQLICIYYTTYMTTTDKCPKTIAFTDTLFNLYIRKKKT